VRILIHPGDLTADEGLRERLEEALNAALKPLGPSLLWVDLYVTDENGPRGGPDKRCRVVAHLRTGAVVVGRTGRDPVEAAAAAARRCRRLIRSRLARRRHRLRRALSA
jgi:hypothetical protein